MNIMMTIENPIEVFRAKNVVEAKGVEAALVNAEIPCSLISFSDTAYPGVVDRGKGWGKILVSEQDRKRAQAVIEDFLKSAPDTEDEFWKDSDASWDDNAEEPRPRKKIRRLSASTLVFFALFLASLFINFILYSRVHHEELGIDADGRRISEAIYRFNIYSPYEFKNFDKRGNHVASSFDKDDDGWVESYIAYHNGTPISYSTDENDDGTFDFVQYQRNGEIVSECEDSDGDGIYEKAIKHLPERNVYLTQEDKDSDGFYEIGHCTSHGGMKRTFDLLKCDLL